MDAVTGPGESATSQRKKLLPEEIVRWIAESFAHLPAPCAAGGQDRRAAVAVVLRDKQRQLALAGIHVGQHSRARFWRAGVLDSRRDR